jgi:ribosome production factor 1
MRRNTRNQKEVSEKVKAKKARRQLRAKENVPKMIPKTIESMREPDATWVDPDDEEVKEDETLDEMASYFSREKEPKVLITTSDNPHQRTIKFCRELKQTLGTAEFRWRNRSSIKKMVKGWFGFK